MYDQQILRSACAYAQSGQSLCKSLEYSIIVKLLTEHHLEFLSLTGGCRGSSESTLVKMPHCWKSHLHVLVVIMLKCLKRDVLSTFGPRREKTCLRWFASHIGVDQPAHPRSLISAFVIHFLESIISRLAMSEIVIV